MLQGLMHHIVLQQRVTLDCALLSHLQDCLLTPHTEAILGFLKFKTCCLGHMTSHVYAPVMWRPGQRKKVCAHAYMC